MATIADVYRTIGQLKIDGIVEDYAVGGGMAALFYAETTPTFDVDVFVVIPQLGLLVDLAPIYEWARHKGFEVREEYLVLHGVPVQILVANQGLETEAIKNARIIQHKGVDIAVMQPEYLVALYIQTGGDKRRGRARDLFAQNAFSNDVLKEILTRYNLMGVWRQNGGQEL